MSNHLPEGCTDEMCSSNPQDKPMTPEEVTLCIGCAEKHKCLVDAVDLIRRGVNSLNRTGWEPGETDDEWKLKAQAFLNAWDMEEEYLRTENHNG